MTEQDIPVNIKGSFIIIIIIINSLCHPLLHVGSLHKLCIVKTVIGCVCIYLRHFLVILVPFSLYLSLSPDTSRSMK